jgi:ATP-dependent helicase/nuclease subunit A
MAAAPGGIGAREWTQEQWQAIDRREGDLLLDAAAGSGKTSVLVERFVQMVLEDGVDVSAILTITFTDKAAGEMRERIRLRLRELGAEDVARATEGAFISTIHAFCARLLRLHALRAGIDPQFRVLDALDAQRLADAAFDQALEEIGEREPGGVELIAAYTTGGLRGAIFGVYGELRSRGEREPRLPALGAALDLEAARVRLSDAAAAASSELGALPDPPVRVVEALDRLERCTVVMDADEPWPGDVAGFALPGGNGAALSTPVCQEYAAALESFRVACEYPWARRAHRLLDALLRSFARRYALLKREAFALDFDDLELLALALVRDEPDVRQGLRSRFERIMVDELQDTNAVQLELVELLADNNLFTVGDAQQAIYSFRHADVELFESRSERLEAEGARVSLRTNFRSQSEILEVVNRTFARELGERFRPLRAGRGEGGVGTPDSPKTSTSHQFPEPRVELILADRGADWDSEALSTPWRVAEARALAARVGELVAGGAGAGEIVVLLRAATDMRVYERALEDQRIPTYVIGGRGYWAHPQVVDMVAYLRALANPRDLEALYTVLVSPLVGISLSTLVILAAASRAAGRDPWWVLQDPEDRLDELEASERERLDRFASWFAVERGSAVRSGVERLIDRVLELTGYDDAVLAMPGGQRRLANLRKLMRLGREQDAASGDPLRDFLELVRFRSAGWSAADASESEAPVEGEGLDAVRLMTIHRAKGLEFNIVCVADLGRARPPRSETLRVAPDGRFGIRLARPGTGRREPALDYRVLGDERLEAEAREERRLFYVAMTRARERLILSGAAKLDGWPNPPNGGPIAWLGPTLVPGLSERAVAREGGVIEGVRVTFVDESQAGDGSAGPVTQGAIPLADAALPALAPPPEAPVPPVTEISYSSLEEHRRCGYRYYLERVLGVQPTQSPVPGGGGLSGAERGVIVHALLEGMDFRRPALPDVDAVCAAAGYALARKDADRIVALVEGFAASETCARLGRATSVRSEQGFVFLLDERILFRGVFDAIAQERGGATLVVDYKTDQLEGAEPEDVVQRAYGAQRLIYALAALRAGARTVEVVHAFLERPHEPAVASFGRDEVSGLEDALRALTADMVQGRFPVSAEPHRSLCHACPAEGGLCSWPLSATRRESAGQLF